MKKQLLKTMAAAAMLLVSTTGVKAQVEGYDFLGWAPSKSGNTFTPTPSSTETTSSSGKTVYTETATFNGHDLNGRFAWESGVTVGATQGMSLAGKRKTAAILNLKAGDIVTIVHNNAATMYVRTLNASYMKDGSTVDLSAETLAENETFQLTSGTAYTMLSAGTFDFYVSGSGTVRLNQISIVTPKVTLGSTGYATYGNLTGATLALPDGLKAYVVNEGSSNKDVATLEEVSNIPAGTGVILKGTAGETYTLSTTADDAATFASNNLVAVTSDMPLAEETESGYTNFILGADGSDVKFYRTTGSGTLKAGKAYLHYKTKYVTTGSEAPALTIEFANGGTTGIGATLVNSEERTVKNVYDLQGRRVAQPTKGLYIVNGKKVVIK